MTVAGYMLHQPIAMLTSALVNQWFKSVELLQLDVNVCISFFAEMGSN